MIKFSPDNAPRFAPGANIINVAGKHSTFNLFYEKINQK